MQHLDHAVRAERCRIAEEIESLVFEGCEDRVETEIGHGAIVRHEADRDEKRGAAGEIARDLALRHEGTDWGRCGTGFVGHGGKSNYHQLQARSSFVQCESGRALCVGVQAPFATRTASPGLSASGGLSITRSRRETPDAISTEVP